MTIDQTDAGVAPSRFRVPETVSPEASAILKAMYEGGEQQPAPTRPETTADFDNANKLMEAAFAPWNQQLAATLGTTIRHETIGDVPVVRITPREHRSSGRALLYVHGGAYVYFSSATLVGLPALIATATGDEVISIDYTLAPRGRWQAVTDQVLAVWKTLLASGLDARSIGLFGDSAGGGLAAGAVLKMRDQHLPLPAALWLVSPWSDVTGLGDTYETLKDADPILTPESLAWAADAYADVADQKHPYVSPVYGDYTKPFPPTLIQGGTREIFLSNFVRQYQVIRDGRHEAVLDLYEGMPHVFHSLVPDAPESKTAIARAATFFDGYLDR
ncbi:alpha/beta hydrolase fold domain-containing protein [Streptomyces sp. QTS52]